MPGATVGDVLRALVEAYPDARERLFDDTNLRIGLSVAVDGEMSAHSLAYPLRKDSELSIIPMIAGGAWPELPASAALNHVNSHQT